MLQDRQDLIVWEFGVEQRGALELGEPGLTNVAIEQAVARPTEEATDREVAGVALAVARTLRALAAEAGEVVRGHETSWTNPCWRVNSCVTSLHIGRIPFNLYRTRPTSTKRNIFFSGKEFWKKLENPRRIWNNGGSNTSSLFQPSEAFE
jgi:hypothetical protein